MLASPHMTVNQLLLLVIQCIRWMFTQPGDCYLVYQSRNLDGDRELGSYGILSDSRLTMTSRIHGGVQPDGSDAGESRLVTLGAAGRWNLKLNRPVSTHPTASSSSNSDDISMDSVIVPDLANLRIADPLDQPPPAPEQHNQPPPVPLTLMIPSRKRPSEVLGQMMV